ncbi:MAG: hypothetical protein DIZ80_02220 [endosymbiont of Galathealinum brachiosum]|uniref:Uncharacterized protein n=1 Tax=endosymbiont of Galathealinum brachiosum TaxID=2200906 RepID=A0A370DK64_9GAMM|nr:MAG: hypothetical protein DIZ80_02220 [endosymbiont of Galathealinum brachiosum]
MQIPLIYVLIIAEVLLVFIGLSITLAVILLRKPKLTNADQKLTAQQAEDEFDAIDLGSSYIDFLEQAMERNNTKSEQQKSIEEEKPDNTEEQLEDKNTSPAPNETQSSLLQAREQFLLMEKAAAENTEHEIQFWDSIYDGMKNLLEQFSTTETISSTESNENPAQESKEKVFYIETQGKKIDGEVNKLKDIIYEQENALSSMKKAMEGAEQEHPEESESLKILKEQIETIERQLSDSKMCMEVLEMENNRLQEEVDKMEARHDSLFEKQDDNKAEESDSLIDLDQIKEVVEQQENKIKQLIDTIESLEIDAAQADKLKDTISDFARTSKEMMSCISILEEENERLKESTEESEAAEVNDSAADNEETDALKSAISSLEEEVIKKDVAFAQLQDEFSSMETEYLAMYEAMHGDNS